MSVSAIKRRRKTLLYLLEKGIGAYQNLLNQTKGIYLSEPIAQRFKIIRKVYLQQLYLIENNTPKVRDRIVSLSKSHIRPIIRGKENKPLEFGIKVHMMQLDGINIVEHHSYNAFNECTRLKASFYKHKIIFGECTHLAADRIYPTNANRRFCSSKNIHTNFVSKGKTSPDKNLKLMKAILNKERSTRLESDRRCGLFWNRERTLRTKKNKSTLTGNTNCVAFFWNLYCQCRQNGQKNTKRTQISSLKPLKRGFHGEDYLHKSDDLKITILRIKSCTKYRL